MSQNQNMTPQNQNMTSLNQNMAANVYTNYSGSTVLQANSVHSGMIRSVNLGVKYVYNV